MQLNVSFDKDVLGQVAKLSPEMIARVSMAMQEAAAHVLQQNGFNISLDNIVVESVQQESGGFSLQGETLERVEPLGRVVDRSESHQFVAKSFDPSGKNESVSVVDVSFMGNQGIQSNEMLVSISVSGPHGTIAKMRHFAGKDSIGLITSENMKAVSPAAHQIVFAGADGLGQATIDYSTIPLPEVKSIEAKKPLSPSLGR